MYRLIVLIFVVGLLMPKSVAFAGSLNEKEFLFKTLENAFEVKMADVETKIAGENEKVAMAAYSMGLFLEADRMASTNSPYEQMVGLNTDSVSVGFNKFFKSHGLFSVEIGGEASDALIRPYGLNTDYALKSAVPFVSFSFRQPLLKNGIAHMPGRVLVDLNKNLKELSLLGARMSLEYFVFNSLIKFHRLLTDMSIQQVNKKSLEDSKALYEKYRKKYELGSIDKTELMKFENQVDLKELNLARSAKQIDNNVESIGMYLEGNIDLGNMELPDTFLPESNKYEEASVISRALENKVDILQAKVIIDNSRLNLSSARNAALPELNMNLSYKFKGYAYNEDIAGLPGALDTLDDYSDVYVGAELKIPFLSHVERAKVMKARYELDKARYDKGLKELLLNVEIKNSLRDLEMVKQEIDTYKNAAVQYREILEQAKKDYDKGRITARELLQTEDDLRRMETGHILARLQYKITILTIELEQGNMLEAYGVDVLE